MTCDQVRGLIQSTPAESMPFELRITCSAHLANCLHCQEWLSQKAVAMKQPTEERRRQVEELVKQDMQRLEEILTRENQ